MQRSALFWIMTGLFILVIVSALVFFVVFRPATKVSKVVPENPVYLDSTQSTESRIDDLLSYMSLDEKIGQMALVERNSVKTTTNITDFGLGGLLSGSGSKPATNTAAGWREMITTYQSYARATRLQIPLLYGTDAIHGHAHVEDMVVFPHMIGLGATQNPDLVSAIGSATAAQMRQTGANWNYAPNLDIPYDIRWGRVYETFGSDSAQVATLGAAYIRGLQTDLEENYNGISVLATPKHYVGLGSMGWGTSLNKNFKIDQGVVLPDETMLREVYLPPYERAIDAGALSIMVGLHTWGDARAITNQYLLTDILKREMGFEGFLVSDWYGVYEGRRSTFLATVEAINAGVDMVMLPFDYEQFIRDVRIANRLGLISTERIDDAVRRILRAKFALGLFDALPNTSAPIETVVEHRALARQAVAESLVVLKNDETVVPLAKNIPRILVAGSAADNTGVQSGAWTLEWQGVNGNVVPGATSILAGIMSAVSPQTEVMYAIDANFDSDVRATVGIAVVGETPYAEGWGDREYPMLTTADREVVERLRRQCDRVIVIVVSGRPLFIAEEINSIDTLIMAWLPGSEGAGVSDVLFGDTSAVGRLPLAWPYRSEQLPLSKDDATADGSPLLYPRGYGLDI